MGCVPSSRLRALLLLALLLPACGNSDSESPAPRATTISTARGEWSVTVPAESMSPTVRFDDSVVVRPLVGDPQRGQIVIFRIPPLPDGSDGDDEQMLKRVIGLPGERVELSGGRVLIDGRPLDEPYLLELPCCDFPPVTVPAGSFWVMGDNRNQSSDSRVFGPVGRDLVDGVAVRIDDPPERRGPLS